MKEILIKYPIQILKKELINVRTGYRLEKKKIVEILKELKVINKLNKDQIIELLIKHNYDINKLPKEYYKLPKKLQKYLDLDIQDIDNLAKDNNKLDSIYRDVIKFFYKNNEEFKLIVEKIREAKKKFYGLISSLEEAKLNKDKKEIEKDIDNSKIDINILYKRVDNFLNNAFPVLIFFRFFDYSILDEIIQV